MAGGDGAALRRLVFDVAYFWRATPAAVLALPLDEFADWVEQGQRIAQEREGG